MNKKILFICPKFFGYEKKIYTALVEQNCIVDIIDESPNNPIVKGLVRLFRGLLSPYLDIAMSKKISKLQNNYNIVFIIKGEYITKKTFNKLKNKFNKAEFVYYNWDSIINSPYSTELTSGCDRSYTFDSLDAYKNTNLTLLPLFYVDDYILEKNILPDTELEWDICFIGTARRGRFSLISKLLLMNNKFSLSLYIYIQSPFMHIINIFLIKNYSLIDKKYLHFSPIPANKIKKMFINSKAILDIHHPAQSGLSMRTFECLASGKKLITTNPEIKNYDFYHENNIFLLENNFSNLFCFLSKPYQDINQNILNKYSISHWVKIILGNVIDK